MTIDNDSFRHAREMNVSNESNPSIQLTRCQDDNPIKQIVSDILKLYTCHESQVGLRFKKHGQ